MARGGYPTRADGSNGGGGGAFHGPGGIRDILLDSITGFCQQLEALPAWKRPSRTTGQGCRARSPRDGQAVVGFYQGRGSGRREAGGAGAGAVSRRPSGKTLSQGESRDPLEAVTRVASLLR